MSWQEERLSEKRRNRRSLQFKRDCCSHLTKAQHPACSVVLGHACRVRVATVAAVATAARLGCQGYANEDDENEQKAEGKGGGGRGPACTAGDAGHEVMLSSRQRLDRTRSIEMVIMKVLLTTLPMIPLLSFPWVLSPSFCFSCSSSVTASSKRQALMSCGVAAGSSGGGRMERICGAISGIFCFKFL
jgi:hypothetical protein